jgi:hypothetical protein
MLQDAENNIGAVQNFGASVGYNCRNSDGCEGPDGCGHLAAGAIEQYLPISYHTIPNHIKL